jgi:hypothetical protein
MSGTNFRKLNLAEGKGTVAGACSAHIINVLHGK